VAAQVLKLTQHNTGMAYKSLARRRQCDPLAIAIEQCSTQMIFQVLDTVAGRRQRQKRTLRTFGHALGARHIDHQLHIRQIKVHGHIDDSIAIISSKLANPSLSKQELASPAGSGKVNGIVMNTDTSS